MNIRSLFLKLILGKKSSSTSYIKHLRNKGAYVGKNTHFFLHIKFLLMNNIPG